MPGAAQSMTVARRKRAYNAAKLYALDNLSTANLMTVQTPASGGEPGIAGGGFGIVTLLQNPAPATRRASSAGWNGGSGWALDMVSTGWRAFAGMTSGSNVSADAGSALPGALDVVFLDVSASLLTLTSARGQFEKTATLSTAYRPGTAPTTDPHMLSSTASGFGNGGRILAQLSYAGTPTLAQKQALSDAIRTAGDIPSKATVEGLLPGCTVRKRWSLKDAIAAASTTRGGVYAGQLAPAIADSVGAAAADLFVRTGAANILDIDPSAYPRTTYAVQGFGDPTGAGTAAPGYASAAGANKGIVGATTGWYIQSWTRISEVAVATFWGARFRGNDGFLFDTNGTDLRCRMGTGSALVTSPTVTRASYAGQWVLITAVFDQPAGLLRLYVNGAQVGSGTAMASYSPNLSAGDSFTIGRYVSNGGANGGGAIGQTSGGHSIPRDAELYQQYLSTMRAGKLVPLGSALHTYDLDLDVQAASGAVPSTLLDRVGTDHLTRTSTVTVSSTTGITGMGEGAFLQTSTTGVTPGNAAGFYAEALIDVNTTSGQQAWFAATSDAGFTTGFLLANNAGKFSVWAGGGTVAAGTNMTLATHHVAFRYDGTVLRTYLDGTQIGTSGTYTHVPSNVATTIGGARGSSLLWPTTTDRVRGAAYGPGAVTDGQIATAASAALSAGKIVGISGITTKMWSIVDDVASASGAIPQRYVERVSGAATDALWLINNTLTIAQRTERLWSFETSPIFTGVETLTLTDYFEAAINALPGDGTLGFTASLLCVITSQSVTGGRHFSQRGSSNPGWEFLSQGSNASVAFSAGGTSSALAASTIAASDVGKMGLYTGVYDPSAGLVRLFAKRVQAQTAGLSTGYSPDATVKAMIGRRSPGNPALGCAIYGVYYVPGIPTLAQVQAQFDLVQATEKIQPVPGLGTGVLLDLLQDTSGGSVPATLTDRGAGGINFTRVGAPTLASAKARAWTW